MTKTEDKGAKLKVNTTSAIAQEFSEQNKNRSVAKLSKFVRMAKFQAPATSQFKHGYYNNNL